MQILPAILAKTDEEAHRKISLVSSSVSWIHLDIMDGSLTNQKSWADPSALHSYGFPLQIELHLMVADPAPFVSSWSVYPFFRRAIWHVEAPIDHVSLLRKTRRIHREAGLAICPETSLQILKPFLAELNEILVMGVEIGASGQTLVPKTFEKVKELHTYDPQLCLGFDGGIQKQHLTPLANLGVTRVCLSHAIFSEPSPEKTLREMIHMTSDI